MIYLRGNFRFVFCFFWLKLCTYYRNLEHSALSELAELNHFTISQLS